jgi:ADP-ribose pyrophosphatase
VESEVRVVDEKTVFQGLRFSVVRRRYQYKERSFARDIVLFPESSVVVPFLTESEIILIRQFRAPLGGYILELPAGVVDKGEKPEDTARRELVEETGYYPRKLIKLTTVYPVPGYSTEIMHIYEAEDLEFKGARPEPYELIETVKVEFREALNQVFRGEIRDAKSVIGIMISGLKRGFIRVK